MWGVVISFLFRAKCILYTVYKVAIRFIRILYCCLSKITQFPDFVFSPIRILNKSFKNF